MVKTEFAEGDNGALFCQAAVAFGDEGVDAAGGGDDLAEGAGYRD